MNDRSQIENQNPKLEGRPWGGYIVLLNERNYKVKRLTINPKKRFSLQYHNKRTETWTIVKGSVEITVGSKKKIYTYGQTVSVPVGTVHRIENVGEGAAEIIEVQTGEYFGEDDIIRLEDDFGRVT